MAEVFRMDAPQSINVDMEPSLLSNERVWNDSNNLVFRDGVAQKVIGYEQGAGDAEVTPSYIVTLRESDAENHWWAYVGNAGTEQAPSWEIYRVTSAVSHTEVTPPDLLPSFVEGAYTWSGDTVNGIPYMSLGIPYYWDGISFAQLPTIPRSDDAAPGDQGGNPRVRFKLTRTYKNFLVGLNFYADDYAGAVSEGWGPWDGSARHDAGIWWSHPVIGKQIDQAEWKDADPTLSSGWNILGGFGGPIVDARPMRDAFIVYRERSVWQMQYIGGIQVFNFKELFTDVGCFTIDCVLDVGGQHLVVGQSDVYMHNGVQKQSVADKKVRREMFRKIDIDYQDKVFIVGDYHNKNAWICIPDVEKEGYVAGTCNTAYVFNWTDNTWFKRDIPNVTTSTFAVISASATNVAWEAEEEGGPLNPDGSAQNPGPGTAWDQLTFDDRWTSGFIKYNPSEWGIILGSADQALYTTYKDNLFDGDNFSGHLTKAGIDFGTPWMSKSISRIIPQVTDGIVNVEASTSYPRDGGVSWKNIGTFDPTQTDHIACRLNGRYLNLRFTVPEESRAKFFGFQIEYKEQGRR